MFLLRAALSRALPWTKGRPSRILRADEQTKRPTLCVGAIRAGRKQFPPLFFNLTPGRLCITLNHFTQRKRP